jgi:hypothetical protein
MSDPLDSGLPSSFNLFLPILKNILFFLKLTNALLTSIPFDELNGNDISNP